MRLLLDCRLGSGIRTILKNVVPHLAPRVDSITLLGDPGELRTWKLATNVRVEPFLARVYSVGEQLGFPTHLAGAVDLLHVPHYNAPLRWRGPFVTTVNDLTQLSPVMPTTAIQRAYVRFFIARALRRANAVLTLTEHVKQELIGSFGPSAERVIVGPLGVDHDHFRPIARELSVARLGKRLPTTRPFILFVGSVRPHKNMARLLEAFARLRAEYGATHDLVVVGEREGFILSTPLLRLPPEIQGAVHFTGYVPDDLLPALYTAADAFILPSLHEGFGLPPLEAMACGTPVAVSNRSSLPEVVGDAGLLLDPCDVREMAAALHRITTDSGLRDALRQRGLIRARRFCWSDTASTYLETYQAALRRA